MNTQRYLVTLSVPRREGEDHPGYWNWSDLLDAEVAVVHIAPIENLPEQESHDDSEME